MMRFLKFVVTAAVAANLWAAQEKAAEPKPAESNPENMEASIIPVKVLSGDSFNRLAKMLAVFNVRYVADDKLRTIVVYAPKDVVEKMRQVVQQLDRPGSEAAIGRNIDINLAFLLCSTKPSTAARSIPGELEPVVRQLKAATPYKDITVLDVVPLRAQEGKETYQSSTVPGLSPDPSLSSATVQMMLRPDGVFLKGSDRFVRFDRIKIEFKVPYMMGQKDAAGKMINTMFQNRDVWLNTAGDFKEGQKTVLGKVSGLDEESTLFIVVSLKILD